MATSKHHQAMMHGYFKMVNISCRIVFDTSLFICKICVLAVSMAYPNCFHAVSGHHSHQVQPFKTMLHKKQDSKTTPSPVVEEMEMQVSQHHLACNSWRCWTSTVRSSSLASPSWIASLVFFRCLTQ